MLGPFHPPIPVTDIPTPPSVTRSREEDLVSTVTTSEMLHGGFFEPLQPPPHVWLDARAYSDPSEEKFERMAREEPETLAVLLSVNVLRPSDLTFAAEAAGRVSDSDVIRPQLLRLLRHESALVREGAVYGLSHHLSSEVRARLESLANDDPSPGVREAAREALETW